MITRCCSMKLNWSRADWIDSELSKRDRGSLKSKQRREGLLPYRLARLVRNRILQSRLSLKVQLQKNAIIRQKLTSLVTLHDHEHPSDVLSPSFLLFCLRCRCDQVTLLFSELRVVMCEEYLRELLQNISYLSTEIEERQCVEGGQLIPIQKEIRRISLSLLDKFHESSQAPPYLLRSQVYRPLLFYFSNNQLIMGKFRLLIHEYCYLSYLNQSLITKHRISPTQKKKKILLDLMFSFLCRLQFQYFCLLSTYFISVQFVFAKGAMLYLKKAFCQSQVARVLECCQYFDPKHPSSRIIQELSGEKEKRALKRYMGGEISESQELALLGLVSCLLVYSNNFQELIQESMVVKDRPSSWLHVKIITPYKKLLRRYCETSDVFSLSGPLSIRRQKFLRDLPYLVSILKEFQAISSQMAKMGRYFTASGTELSKTICFFAEAHMIFLDGFYSYLRMLVQSYLHYLKHNSEEIKGSKNVLNWFFVDVLPKMNESITNLNCLKYFGFHSKGLCIKLLKIQELSTSIESVIQEIMAAPEEINLTMELSSLIFPEDGSFNHQLFLQAMKTPTGKENTSDSPQQLKYWRKQSSATTTSSEPS